MKQLMLIPLLVVLMSGCATLNTEVSSIIYPGFERRTFSRILLVVEEFPLAGRLHVEKALTKHLADTNTQAVAGTAVMPPLDQCDPTQMRAVIIQNEIDAILFVARQEAYIAKGAYMPGFTTTSTQYDIYGDSITGYSTTQTMPGYHISEWHLRGYCNLASIETYESYWFCSLWTTGTNCNVEGFIDSFAEGIINKLIEDGFISRKSAIE